jgi:hypothetical protein
MEDNSKHILIEKKECTKCNILKNICEFRVRKDRKCGYRSSCKECEKVSSKKWIEKNIDYYKKRTKVYNKKHYIENIELYKEKNKNYYLNNTLYCKQSMVFFKKNNPNYKKQYEKEKREIDPIYRLSMNVRNRINKFLKLNNITKQNKTFDIVGCSPKFLKEHIENQFKEGMSLHLIGKRIHIDHIIPLSFAKTEEEILKLCHYTNLQPLWAEDNLKKGSNY